MSLPIYKTNYTMSQKQILAKLNYLDDLYSILRQEIDIKINDTIRKKSEKKDQNLRPKFNKDSTKIDENKEGVEPPRDPLDFTRDSNIHTKILKKCFRKLSIYVHPDKTDDISKIEDFNIIKQSVNDGILYKLFLVSIKHNLNLKMNKEHENILLEEIVCLDHKVKILQNHKTLTS